MVEQGQRAELEEAIQTVSGDIGTLMSRWPAVEISIEQSVWTIHRLGFDKPYPKRAEDKLEYIKAFVKRDFVPRPLRDRVVFLASTTKGVLKTRNIIAHSYICRVDKRTTDVLFTRIWIKHSDEACTFGTKTEKRKIGELRKHAEQCVELSFELPYLPHALREALGQADGR